MNSRVPRIKGLKLTAALYASREGVVSHVRATGKLPQKIHLEGGWIGMNLLIERRGTDIDLSPDEELVYDALCREKPLRAGGVILVEPAFEPKPD